MRHRAHRALRQPFPDEWRRYLSENLRWWSNLGEGDRRRLEDLIRIFLIEKTFEGTRDFAPTEQMKLTIAAQACLLILGLDYDLYEDVSSIIISPTVVRHHGQRHLDGNVMSSDNPLLSGQAMLHGPVLIVWDRLADEARHPERGHNVVFHEFAHKLDLRDGMSDGAPPMSTELKSRWEPTILSILQRLRDDASPGLDAYGGTNPTELLAVATEAFFDTPSRLERDEPDLYGLLRDFYHQDPAAWPTTNRAN